MGRMQAPQNDLDTKWLPDVLNPLVAADEERLRILKATPGVRVVDHYVHQVRELVKIRQVGKVAGQGLLDTLVADELNADQGVWVFYPWSNTLVHLLNECDFVFVRTNRNRDKITEEEQSLLAAKRVGVIGMSVGRAVATTMALERIFRTLKIADHDTLDLSNLNRLKAPLADLGLSKTISVAREILGVDPFLDIQLYSEGITKENIDSFLLEGGKLDLLIDECDSLEIKILCRQRAKEFGIPVIMETSDRGMVDIERFDEEPGRPIFHGRLEEFDLNILDDPELRWQVLMKIVDFEKLSLRARLSLPQIGKKLSTWPQLASAVVSGGGVVTDTARRVMLGERIESGRYYFDIEGIIRKSSSN